MKLDSQLLRLDGIYQQKGADRYMQRIKVPAGALSAEQALKVAALAERLAGGRLHLTTRGSIELHDVAGADLPTVQRGLAAVGLTGRGACGGAVRGVSCSTVFGPRYREGQALARKLHRHFAGNPWFEGLPKKFKIGVDGDYGGSRHLIQDIGLVFAAEDGDRRCWDVWCAGGLGREPRAAFLLANRVPEQRLLPLIEAVLRVYRRHAPKGRRLKHVVAEIGEKAFRDLVRDETRDTPPPTAETGLGQTLNEVPTDAGPPLYARIFAGELSAPALRALATAAGEFAGGTLAITADQDLAFLPASEAARRPLAAALAAAGFDKEETGQRLSCRICPGSHECKMGLAPTREIGRWLTALPERLRKLSWAVSGCPNACSQPQLAEFGIVSARLVKEADGSLAPRFNLLRRGGEGLGEAVSTDLDLAGLKAAILALADESNAEAMTV
jgi:sulfite reductase beta subunit-like hemoprotein